LVDFGMVSMVDLNLFVELQASDCHSPTQKHVLATTHQKAKVSYKKKPIDRLWSMYN